VYCRCTATLKTSLILPADVDSVVVAAVDVAVLVPENTPTKHDL